MNEDDSEVNESVVNTLEALTVLVSVAILYVGWQIGAQLGTEISEWAGWDMITAKISDSSSFGQSLFRGAKTDSLFQDSFF